MDRLAYCCPDCGEGFPSRYSLGQHMKTSHPIVPQVLNKKDYPGGLPPNSTYVGRGTFAGNPFIIGIDGTRDEVINHYEYTHSLDKAFVARVRKELKGRHLVCHCAPERCHADWLLCVANS